MAPSGINFRIVPDSRPNASTDGRTITVNTGMLSFVANKDQMAIVIGHELGHIAHGDSNHRPSFQAEYAADSYGVSLANRRGYNGCHGIEIWKRLGDDMDYQHPSSRSRYERLAQQCHL